MRINASRHLTDLRNVIGLFVLEAFAGSIDEYRAIEPDENGDRWVEAVLTIDGREVDLEAFMERFRCDFEGRLDGLVADRAMGLVNERFAPLFSGLRELQCGIDGRIHEYLGVERQKDV